jgi:hypothetical protein
MMVCPLVPMKAKLLTLPTSLRPDMLLLLLLADHGRPWRGTCTPRLLA